MAPGTAMEHAPERAAHGAQRRHYLSASAAAELRNARRRQGLSLRALEARTGIAYGYLGMLERGQRAPSVEVARLLAPALRLEPDAAARLMAEAVPDAGRSWRAPG